MSENNGDRKITTAEELVMRSRQVVDLPGGLSIQVRRLGKGKMAEIVRGIPDVSALALLKGKTVKDVETEIGGGTVDRALAAAGAVTGIIDGVLIAGVVSPRLFANPDEGPTPDHFTEEERSALFNAICGLSEFTEAAGKEVLPLSKTAG